MRRSALNASRWKLIQTIIGSAAFVPEDITVNPEMNEINIAVRPQPYASGAGAESGTVKAARYRQGADAGASAILGHKAEAA